MAAVYDEKQSKPQTADSVPRHVPDPTKTSSAKPTTRASCAACSAICALQARGHRLRLRHHPQVRLRRRRPIPRQGRRRHLPRTHAAIPAGLAGISAPTPSPASTSSPRSTSARCSSPSASSSSRPTSCSGPARRSCSTCAARSSATSSACHLAFFDRNPVGRLVTRVTSDVDALNEMFTSGVLAIFEDVFTLAFIVIIMLWMSWPLALLTLSVIPAILFVTRIFRAHVRDSYRRQRAATAKINSFTQEYVSGMSRRAALQPRAPRLQRLLRRQRRKQAGLDRRHLRLRALLPRRRVPQLHSPSHSSSGAAAAQSCTPIVAHLAHCTPLRPRRTGDASTSASSAPSPSASSSPSSSTRSASSAPSWTSARSTTSCRPPWPPASASSSSSTPSPPSSRPRNPIPGDGTGSIEFRNVWFTYQKLERRTTHAVLATSANPEPPISRHRVDPPRRHLHHRTPAKPPPSSATPAPAKPPSSP